ncbi:MAG: bifunctional aspartate kinase/homoserine dehydrogenase I, partial [Chlorobiaceae bacterium]|nr:bifunctional aspartate kinase/homoserine dehydrogenase I [Chlorobiaceae bacterium]
MRVYKFGGSSIGSASKIRNVAGIIRDGLSQSPLVVVVSAVWKVTDMLADAATLAGRGEIAYLEKLDEITSLHDSIVRELFHEDPAEAQAWLTGMMMELHDAVHGIYQLRELSDRNLAQVLSFGERLSSWIVSRYLQCSGTPSLCIDARELIVTDDNYCYAKVETQATGKLIRERLHSFDAVPVVTGFIA